MKRHYLILAALAGLTRFINLGGESLWYDEAFTAQLAKLPLNKLFTAVSGDVHPPTFYLVEWLNIRIFGTSEWALRLPSAIAGIVAVLLIYRLTLAIGRNTHPSAGFTPQTAFVAGLIATCMGAALYYSQESRVYSLMVCFVLFMMIGAVRGNMLQFFVGAVGTVYSHNLGVFYVAAVGGVMLLRDHQIFAKVVHGKPDSVHRYWAWAMVKRYLALAGTVAAWAPWAVVMLRQMKAIEGGFWIAPLSLGGALNPVATMTIGFRASEFLQLVGIPASYGLLAVGLIASRRWIFRRSGLLLLAAIFLAPMGAALASWLWKPVYLPRAFLASGMMISILWAYGLVHLSRPNRRAMALATIPVLIIGVLSTYFPPEPRSNIRTAVQPVREEFQPGDVIYYSSIPPAILAGYYLPFPSAISPDAGDLNQQLPADAKAVLFDAQSFPPVGYRRAWYVFLRNFGSRSEEIELQKRITAFGTLEVKYTSGEINSFEIWLIDLNQARAGWTS